MRGHIRKRGNSWAVVVDVGRDENGRRRQKWHSGFRTKREASEALTEILGRLGRGQYVSPSSQTLREFLETDWLPSVSSSLRPLTFDSYRANVLNHVVPHLGELKLQGVTPAALNTFYGELSESLSPTTIRYIHAILRRAFADAVRWNRLPSNPADGADPPRKSSAARNAMRTWSAPELHQFLEGVSQDRLAACWRFLAMTGCRRGEALGLRWRDIDFARGQATILQAIVGGRATSEPKSESGRRTIALDVGTLAALRRHREAQRLERDVFGDHYSDNDLVFCREDGTPMWPRSLSRAFSRRIAALDLPRIRLHDLRHTHATLALQAGIHPKVVQERLGHASISITLDIYSHATQPMQQDAASQVAALVDPDLD